MNFFAAASNPAQQTAEMDNAAKECRCAFIVDKLWRDYFEASMNVQRDPVTELYSSMNFFVIQMRESESIRGLEIKADHTVHHMPDMSNRITFMVLDDKGMDFLDSSNLQLYKDTHELLDWHEDQRNIVGFPPEAFRGLVRWVTPGPKPSITALAVRQLIADAYTVDIDKVWLFKRNVVDINFGTRMPESPYPRKYPDSYEFVETPLPKTNNVYIFITDSAVERNMLEEMMKSRQTQTKKPVAKSKKTKTLKKTVAKSTATKASATKKKGKPVKQGKNMPTSQPAKKTGEGKPVKQVKKTPKSQPTKKTGVKK